MKNGFSSDTAVTTAVLRAVHLLLDDQPPIFRDELAGALVGMRDDAEVLAAASAFERELATLSTPDHAHAAIRNARANVTARARYAEDELEKACSTSRRGVIAKKAAPRSPTAENRAGPSSSRGIWLRASRRWASRVSRTSARKKPMRSTSRAGPTACGFPAKFT